MSLQENEIMTILVLVKNIKHIQDYLTHDFQVSYPTFKHALDVCVQSFDTFLSSQYKPLPNIDHIEPEPIMIIETIDQLAQTIDDLIDAFYIQLAECRDLDSDLTDDDEFFICDTIDIMREPFWEFDIDL